MRVSDRYAVDDAIFCTDKAEATDPFSSEKLGERGIALQKKKTRILTAQEFRETAQLLIWPMPQMRATEEQKLLSISCCASILTAYRRRDYQELKGAIQEIDIIGNPRPRNRQDHDRLRGGQAGKAVQAILVLDHSQRLQAVSMLLDGDNVMTLAPVFV
ncbi:MAG: hypothetical protein IPH76_18895 [Xanthomonadales bacterium]|nr:hypothetical protein [Xanthomonadales bacterium]